MEEIEAIAKFLYKLHCGEMLTDNEQAFLAGWRSESPTHEELYQSIMDPSIALQELQEFAAMHGVPIWNEMPRRRHSWKHFLAAATLAGIVSVGAWFWHARNAGHSKDEAALQVAQDIQPGGNKATLMLANGSKIVLDSMSSGAIARQGNVLVSKADSGSLFYKPLGLPHSEILYNTLATPKAGQFQLTLPDGTKVCLNNASSLRYPVLFGATREVILDGEAYFEVAKDPSRPFKVKVGEMDVEVLGTSFNISAYREETTIKTTLLSGSIQVCHNGDSILVHPGEQALLATGSKLTIKRDANLDVATSWKDGLFNFDNSDLQSVMRQLARWYDIDVHYEADIPLHNFVGYIERNLTLTQVLEILKKNECHFKVEGRTVTVMP